MTIATGTRARRAATSVQKQSNTGQSASKQRLRLWLRLLRSSRAIESELRERLRLAFAVTLPQFDVMAALARNTAGMTMTEVSRLLMVSNGNITGIIDRLVADGVVVREAIAGDRRGVCVKLTPVGVARFADMAAAHEAWIDEVLSDFTTADTDMLIDRLDGLARRVRNGGKAR